MASSLKLFWAAALLAAVMTSCMVRTAPTGGQGLGLSDVGKFQEEVLEKAGKTQDVDKAVEDALAEDDTIEKEETIVAEDGTVEALKKEEEEKEEVVDDAMDEVLNEGKDEVVEDLTDDIINDADSMETDDVMDTGSSSQPDASDYQWEPSYEYDLSEGNLDTWYLYQLPDEPSEWSSNVEILDEQYFPYYGSSYEDLKGVDTGDDLDNNLVLDVPAGLFNGVPTEELNNKVDQTVDEFLCMLGLCDDVRVYPDDDVLDAPNELQFTEEGMTGNADEVEEESEEKDIYTVDAKPVGQKEDAKNSSAKAEAEADVQPSLVGSKHRSKRDLSWDQLEQDNELLRKINYPQVEEAEEELAEDNSGLTAAGRFEDLLEYFKQEAAENEKTAQEEEIYLGVPEPILNEIVQEATGGEFQDVAGDEEELEEDEEQENRPDGIEETGRFLEDAEDVEGGDGWGAYLDSGSPYVQDTLKYDGYKRDDEREALKVYIESLQNLEGYRKRNQGDDGSQSTDDFLRKLVPRSPPNAIRYPKTGLEPFSREKYFPLFPDPNYMEEDGEDDAEVLIDPAQEELIDRYYKLMELLNDELETAALISTIKDMAAELGRDRQLLDELAEEEAQEELQLALDENNDEILDLVGISKSHPMKRAPRVIDYPDFNEYPPEFLRSMPALEENTDSLSQEELLRLYEEYLNEAAEEANWGDFVNPPRERREGEDTLPGPHGAYYVQGRMLGNLMKPKRDWDFPEAETDQRYILLDPSDLGYVEWPGDFEIFYDTRDGTYVWYPYPKPQDASVLSDEALLDALGLSERNFVIDDGDDEEGEEWGEVQDDGVLQNDLKGFDEEMKQLENLQILTEIAAKLGRDDERARQEETLLRALLGE